MESLKVFFLLLWIIFAALLFLFGNNLGGFVVFVASITLPIIAGVTLVVMSRFVHMRLALDSTGAIHKGATCNVHIVPSMSTRFCKIICTVTCTNSFTGETTKEELLCRAGTGNNALTLQATHVGILKISISKVVIHDPFGLFSMFGNCKNTNVAEIYVMPSGYCVDVLLPDNIYSAESDQYSTTHAGYDASETHAIRNYAPGDAIRSIHWKLTEKLDKVMVREFGLPINGDAYVMLDPTGQTAAELDTQAEEFFSTALAYVEKGVRTVLSFRYKNDETQYNIEVSSVDDVVSAMWEYFRKV